MPKTRDREVFYKYRGPRQAIRVLQDLQLAWASPLTFNDPFDTQGRVRLGCTGSEMADAFAPEIERPIFSDEPLPAAMHPLVAGVISAARPLAKLADPQDIRVAMRPGIYEGAEKSAADLEKFAGLWPQWLRELRVICVSEINDDILMWSHYADCHRGVVIELKCIPEKDTAFCEAQPVNYRPDIPVMGTAEQWVKHVTGKELLPLDDLFEMYTLTKSSHWAYEKEWRCLQANPDGARDVAPLVTLREILPEEISAVYFGCRISPEHREEILRLVASRVPHAKVFQGLQSETEFKLEFERIE
jgi:Protein of unknown function (DUF2971)